MEDLHFGMNRKSAIIFGAYCLLENGVFSGFTVVGEHCIEILPPKSFHMRLHHSLPQESHLILW